MGVLDRIRGRTPEPVDRATPDLIHQRDPTAATRALRWVSPGRAAPPDWDAAVAFQRAYYANVIVYACFQAIANTIAGLPFRAGPDPDKPQDYDTKAPLARLLGPPPGGPNPGMDAETLWYFLIVQYLVTGRLGAELETDNAGTPIALWPLVSASLNPVPSTGGTAWFKEFLYGRNEDLKTLPVDRMLYAWNPSGLDFRQPESAIQAAHLDVNVAVMQGRYDYAFLKNDARPAAVVVTEQFEDDDAYSAFKSSFEARHRGPDNAGNIAFVETTGSGDQGVKGAIAIEQLGFSPKDAQAAQRHSDAMQRIALALGVPWSRLDASGRTFDNASEEDKIWWTQRLLPLVRRLQSAVNIQVAPRVGSEVGWFDLSKIAAITERKEPVTQKATADVLVKGRIFTQNEARADYGLPPIDGGDEMFVEPEAPAPVIMPPAPVPVLEPVPEPAELTATAPQVETRESPEDGRTRRARIWKATDATVRNMEATFERGMRRLFKRQRGSVLARLEGKRGRAALPRGIRATVDEVFDPAHWTTETAEAVRDFFEAITAAGGARVSEHFGLAFDLSSPYAQAFVAERANQLAGNVTSTTYEQIKAAIAEGVAEGEGIPDIAKRIQGVFEQADVNRATTIARTETISAYNGSASVVAANLGGDVVGGQEWIATADGRTRESHAEMDGEIQPIGGVFSNDLAYPGDPAGDSAEVVNCRCTVGFLTPDEMGDRAPRAVDVRTARALLSTVAPGRFDEPTFRIACEVAA